MATEKRIITLHEALEELKTIDARISKAVDNARLVGITQGQSDKIWNLTKDEFTKKKIGLEELFKYEESRLRALIALQLYDLASEYKNKINLTIEEEKIRLSNNIKGLKNRQDKESS